MTQSEQDYQAIRYKIFVAETKKKKIFWIILISGIIATTAFHFLLSNTAVYTLIFLFFVASLVKGFVPSPNRWLTFDEYYSIEGSRNEQGHTCIFCGNKGIYRKGEYRGNNQYAYCSKCRKELFIE